MFGLKTVTRRQGNAVHAPPIPPEMRSTGRDSEGQRNCAVLLRKRDALTDAYENYISRQPGFIAAGLHVNDAKTRIANYSQWQQKEDFLQMLRTPEMRERNRHLSLLCRSFEPVMYEVAGTFGK